jgi:alpha-galactosidase
MRSVVRTASIVGFVLLSAIAAFGGTASKEEGIRARKWMDTHLLADHAAPAFSFAYGGRPFATEGRSWPVVRESRNLDDNRIEHTLTWTDPATRLEVRCVVTEFRDTPAVEWVLYLHNAGSARTPIIESIRPLDTELMPPGTACTLHYSMGDSNSAESFAPREKSFKLDEKEPFVLAPTGGRSSDPYLPFFNLAGADGGVAIAVGWSGQWEARFERSSDGALRVRTGQQLTHLSLLPGETIRTPRMLLVFWEGSQPLRGSNLMRQVMIGHYLPRRGGQVVYSPICASVNWPAPDGTYEGPHMEVLPALAKRGVEVFWSDMDPQQWYPGGFPNGTGTWEVDPAKYPHGLRPIGDAVKAAGMEYLLWFEPERVHEGTKIDLDHPEWVIKKEGTATRLFRLHDTAARKWLTDCIDRHVTAARLGWVRWDFNMNPLPYWRQNDASDRQGITEIGHVEGLYAMWDDLRTRHPGLVIDNCASGGRRIDLETCTRGLPLWHSDMQCSGKADPPADQLQNAGLFRWVPMHGCAAFDYEPSYTFRSAMTAGNIVVHGNTKGQLDTADADTEQAVGRTVAMYKKIRPYMLGDFYPLFPHVKSEDAWFGYQFHRADQQAGMAVVFRRAKAAAATTSISLNDIEPAGRYEITWQNSPEITVVDGARLTSFPVTIDAAPGSAVVYYRKVRS